ncbi:MAG: hypothetical protein CMF96_01825 [Candidatus Marinimicrobia bacterium]|nr:hypothetical protein [Candidatus Neomarinimicrobiota bacterium]
MNKQINLLLILISFSFSTILNVNGEEYTTIQSAIDAAETGDTVLVHQGLYYENLDIDKTITLASLAMYDNLDTWYEYESITAQYEINNDNIVNTIIDASEAVDENFTSGIVVRSPEDECISPVIMGFTIRGGMGTMVAEDTEDGEVNRKIGGGLFSYMTNADIHHNQFTNNGDPSVENGGAVYAQTSTEDWGFDNRSSGRPRCEINEINIHDNFYRDNDAIYGNTFSNRTFTNEINLTNSLFDIYNCPESNVTGVWVDIQPEAEPDYSGSQGDLCAITDDVWVSPIGNDYTGLATTNNPIRTIKYALEIIAPSDDNQITIYLDEGTYSPSLTGETFSLLLISNVNLIGAGEELTILDAEQTKGVMYIDYCENNIISNLSISGGNTDSDWYSFSGYGGGVYLESSNPIFNNITIFNNMADYGGGMNLLYSNPTLNNVTIFDNIADYGGGMHLWESNPIFNNVTISNNTGGYYGGGMSLGNSNPTLINMTISNNMANYGGGMNLWESNPKLINSIIWDNNPESIYLDFDEEPIIIYSDIQGGWEGQGNIDSEPLFTDPENGDYTLQEISPCIDTGTAYLEIDGEVIVDLDGSEYIGSAPDMGAYEYNTLSIDKPVEILPIEYSLEYPYPNPFNPITNINYSLPKNNKVMLKLYNINGELISTLDNGLKSAGNHTIEWNAEGYQSGVYFVKLDVGEFTQTQKLMLVK